MIVTLIFIGLIVYLVIGRIIAEKRWEWDGYSYFYIEEGIFITTIFWPVYLFWLVIKAIASIFVDIE